MEGVDNTDPPTHYCPWASYLNFKMPINIQTTMASNTAPSRPKRNHPKMNATTDPSPRAPQFMVSAILIYLTAYSIVTPTLSNGRPYANQVNIDVFQLHQQNNGHPVVICKLLRWISGIGR